MKRYVIVSTTNNIDYFFYAPFLEKAWNKLEWNICIMITDDVNESDLKLSNPESIVIRLPKIEGLRDATIAQAGRLYAANYFPDETLLMTSDMDLLPLSDYWNPNPDETTVYGHDLTDYTFYPRGYVALTAKRWKDIFMLKGEVEKEIERDCKEIGIAYSPDWGQWWNHDWTLLTKRIKGYAGGFAVRFIDRGRRSNSPFAFGRIDRGDSMQIPSCEMMIDAHCENNNVLHPDKLNKFLFIFEKTYGKL